MIKLFLVFSVIADGVYGKVRSPKQSRSIGSQQVDIVSKSLQNHFKYPKHKSSNNEKHVTKSRVTKRRDNIYASKHNQKQNSKYSQTSVYVMKQKQKKKQNQKNNKHINRLLKNKEQHINLYSEDILCKTPSLCRDWDENMWCICYDSEKEDEYVRNGCYDDGSVLIC